MSGRCSRGVVLGNVVRFCHRPPGHAGDHQTIWLGQSVSWPRPTNRPAGEAL